MFSSCHISRNYLGELAGAVPVLALDMQYAHGLPSSAARSSTPRNGKKAMTRKETVHRACSVSLLMCSPGMMGEV